MKTSRRIVRLSVAIALAAIPALIHAQDNNEPKKRVEGEKKRPPAKEHSAPPQRQQTDAQQQRTRPAQSSEQPIHKEQRPRETPVQPQRTEQPRNQRMNPVPQQQPTVQPGNQQPEPRYRRPDGSRPDNQPGRTFGTPPGAANPRREPAMNEGRTFPAPRTVTTRNGDVIHRNSDGQVTQVRTNNGTVVYHPPNAPRRIEVVRPGGQVVVAHAPGHGYVQRQVVIQNTTIIKRTYVYGGVPHARLYRPVIYGGVTLAVYTPVHYYRPGFYYYAYNPWARPVYYSWGWGGRPWYGYYGGYFSPYPYYASPALWLTDYLIAATLEAAYEERMAARVAPVSYGYDGGQQSALTPDVKQAISEEVRRQIDLERSEGQNAGSFADNPTFADNAQHVFVVHDTLAVNSNAGECTIAEGDVLQMNGAPPRNASSADVLVLASRGMDCRKGSTVSVPLQDLQEMQNQMRATIDRGMSDLQAKQGQSGLPELPPNTAGTIDSPYAKEAKPDSDAGKEITGASREADQVERDAISQSPPTLSLGLTVDEVTAIQGRPEKIVDLGSKKTYLYKDLKVTFTDGKVTDIIVQ